MRYRRCPAVRGPIRRGRRGAGHDPRSKRATRRATCAAPPPSPTPSFDDLLLIAPSLALVLVRVRVWLWRDSVLVAESKWGERNRASVCDYSDTVEPDQRSAVLPASQVYQSGDKGRYAGTSWPKSLFHAEAAARHPSFSPISKRAQASAGMIWQSNGSYYITHSRVRGEKKCLSRGEKSISYKQQRGNHHANNPIPNPITVARRTDTPASGTLSSKFRPGALPLLKPV